MKLFGTSGIRGYIDEKLRPENVAKIGLAIAKFFGENSLILVGYDHRYQSIPIKLALESGLLAGGVDVIDVGLMPTPGVLHVLKYIGADGAVVVTGSHTPPDIDGILVFKYDTSELSHEEEREIEKIYLKENFNRANWKNLGTIEYIEDASLIYQESVLKLIKLNKVEGRKIVVDSGNSVASGILKMIFQSANIDVVAINDYMDPEFRGRDPQPTIENLQKMGKVAKAIRADISVGVDGDGDRAIFGDELGNIYWGDVTGTIFVKKLLREGVKKFVMTINTSSIPLIMIERAGGKVFFSKVGPPSIAYMMKKNNAPFGFEESGKFVWSDAIYYGDAALATLRLLEILEEEGKSLSELVKELPQSLMIKKNIPCPDELKQKVLEEAYSLVIKEIPKEEIREIYTFDGYKIMLKDYSWILLRPSGTEPVFRVFAESLSSEKAKWLARIGENAVKSVLEKLRV